MQASPSVEGTDLLPALPAQENMPADVFLSVLAAAAGPAASAKSSDSSMGSLADGGSGPASLLTTSNQASLSVLGHSEDLPPSAVPPQQNRYDAAFTAASSLTGRDVPTSLWFSFPSLRSAHPSQQNNLPSSSGRTSNSSILVRPPMRFPL